MMAAPAIPPKMIRQLPTPVMMSIAAPTNTQSVEVSAMDPGMAPLNISIKE